MYDKYINMESGFDMYMNSGYNFDRTPKKTLLVRWHSSGSDQKTIDLSLNEPFKIDALSDIYLDNFTTYHNSHTKPGFSSPEKSAFVLNINEFNIQSNVAGEDGKRNNIFNNIIIPSDALSINTSFSPIIRSHKSKKMNFVCSINPTTITKITGSITDLNGGNIFDGNVNDMFLAEFVFVARK
tara:strand:+ start:397 stop:945 length:549 start_codon:yes stop_codon:yes gene_type:complete